MEDLRKPPDLSEFPPYSYRDTPGVPNFPEDRPLIVFDGVCVLCSAFVRFVITRDTKKQFLLTTAQSELGQALYRYYGLDPVNFETNLLITDGRAYAKLASITKTLALLGGPWRIISILGYVPRSVGDWLYDRIARNRYRLFGRHDTCAVPGPDWRSRIIS